MHGTLARIDENDLHVPHDHRVLMSAPFLKQTETLKKLTSYVLQNSAILFFLISSNYFTFLKSFLLVQGAIVFIYEFECAIH